MLIECFQMINIHHKKTALAKGSSENTIYSSRQKLIAQLTLQIVFKHNSKVAHSLCNGCKNNIKESLKNKILPA